jgi:hypothetical protein
MLRSPLRGRLHTVLKLMGSLTLVYGDGHSRNKTHNGIAFKDTATARQVARHLLAGCDLLDAMDEAKIQPTKEK